MKDFIELIKNNAKNYPQKVAVIDGERKISYADFFNLISSISHQLICSSSKPKIVFDLKQGVEAYALIVAVLNVGGTYCPLNPDAPIDRKMQIINEFEPDFIVVEAETKVADFSTRKTITIEKLLTERNYTAIENDYNGEDIIYVIYTSGSTGMPKGVMICRKALNKFLEWSIPTYGAGGDDIWGQFSMLSFDLSIVDIFTCLCSGATLLVMGDASSKIRPSSVIEGSKITIWHSIPSAIDFMIKSEKSKKADFSSLRLMSFCGEPLKKYHLDFLFKKNRTLSIFNTYGPTEGTLFCTWQKFKIDNYLNFCEASMSIGKAIPGWNIHLNYIEDTTEKEVIIYGDYIGKGYIGDTHVNRFKDLNINGKKFTAFETGDLVIEKSGNLFFSCRKDRQVKIKGYRIELDEIDVWIRRFLTKHSVTIVHNNGLYSFIETEGGFDEKELRSFLSRELEAYKVPRAFITVKEIPRNANLKVNISALIELIP